MNNFKTILLTIVFALLQVNSFAAEGTSNDSTNKEHSKVYIFGVGSAFGDTIVHFTSIIELDNITLEKKTKFLPMRSIYSLQLKAYLEGVLGLNQQTCCVIFSTSKKKISKKYYKLKKEYLENSGSTLKIIGEDDFKFVQTQ